MIARIVEGRGKQRRTVETPLEKRGSVAEGLCGYLHIQAPRK